MDENSKENVQKHLFFGLEVSHYFTGLSWSWSYGSWIYNYLYNQCLSPLKLWVQTLFMERCMQHYVIKFVSDLRQVSGFLRVLRFPPPIKLTAIRYNWHIVESGIKHHKPYFTCFRQLICLLTHPIATFLPAKSEMWLQYAMHRITFALFNARDFNTNSFWWCRPSFLLFQNNSKLNVSCFMGNLQFIFENLPKVWFSFEYDWFCFQ